MRELRVDMFCSVDGFSGPGPRSDAYWGYGGPGLDNWVEAQLVEDHVALMGARTYRELARIHQEVDSDPLPRMSAMPKIVFSSTLTNPLSWPNTTLIASAIETAVPALKAGDGPPMRTAGSPSLVRSLFQLGLVDRLRLMVFPMIHGTAGEQPAFAELPSLELDLIGTTVLDDRLVFLDYRVGDATD